MGKPPAFSLYASDFYMDTSHWTPGQVGAYFRLLMYEWVNGGVPRKMAAMARIAGLDVRNMQKMWSAEIAKKFVPDGAEMYVNLRLEETRQKQANFIKSQSEKGKKSAEIRAKLHPTGVEPELQPESNLSSSSSISSLKRNKIIFIKPTLEEITSYCKERNNSVDPEQWMNHYVSNGWKVGNNPMKDWKATVRTWEKNEGQFSKKEEKYL